MFARFLSPLLVSLLCVAGCMTLSADPRLVGHYAGSESEVLIFEQDTSVYHGRLEGGKQRRVFLGFASPVRGGSQGELAISGPDTSPFLGTSFLVSEDYRRVQVTWETVQHMYTPQATEFRRKPNE